MLKVMIAETQLENSDKIQICTQKQQKKVHNMTWQRPLWGNTEITYIMQMKGQTPNVTPNTYKIPKTLNLFTTYKMFTLKHTHY